KRVFMDRVVHDFLEEMPLEDRDRRFFVELCYGSVRHRNTLRAVSEHYLHAPLEQYHRTVRVALSLGLYQRIYLKTPPHAVVNSTVAAWKQVAGGRDAPHVAKSVGLLNAVLRRACDEMEHYPLEAKDRDDPECLRGLEGWVRIPGLGLPSRADNLPKLFAIKYSHPPDMIRIWRERYPEETLVQILERNNRPPPIYLVVRTGRVLPDNLKRRFQLAGHTVEETPYPGVLQLTSHASIPTLPGYDSGEFWVQDVTSFHLAQQLPERKEATLLDLCAAPGGKLATLLDRRQPKSVLACDLHEGKLRGLAQSLQRLRFDATRLGFLEAPYDPDELRLEDSFDQVLVDAPCSNTGVLNRRHEARWRYIPEILHSLERTQMGLLKAAARHLKRGGDLLYTTCSLEPGENSQIAHAFMRAEHELRLVQEVEILPGEGGGDGGYGALFQRQR
ncbi:MAG: transcription antitermination factor NusB, partial [Planctomycetota bacterium]